jgi:hypothetical protein
LSGIGPRVRRGLGANLSLHSRIACERKIASVQAWVEAKRREHRVIAADD